MRDAQNLVAKLKRHCPQASSVITPQHEVVLTVSVEDWLATARLLRDIDDLQFSQLIDLCAMDMAGYGQGEWRSSDMEQQVGGYSRAKHRIDLCVS